MSALYSTHLANHVAVTGSLRAALNSGFLKIFSGPVPASADAAVDGSSVLLATLSVGGDGSTGLTFEATATNGVLTKTASEAWQGTVLATGTATFWRFCESGDAGTALSTSTDRVQGTVGVDGTADMILSSAALTSGDTQAITVFNLY